MDSKLTKDCKSENHVPHYLFTESATRILRSLHDGVYVALAHPHLHLLLHFDGTERWRKVAVSFIAVIVLNISVMIRWC